MDAASTLNRSFDLQIGKYTIAPTYWQAAAIVFLIFLLIITLASVRRHFMEWTVKGAGFGVVLGFILALIVEAFLLLGGRTALSEVLGWENAPKPIAAMLQAGRDRLVNVLGVTDEIPQSHAQSPEDLIQTLPPEELDRLREYVCK